LAAARVIVYRLDWLPAPHATLHAPHADQLPTQAIGGKTIEYCGVNEPSQNQLFFRANIQIKSLPAEQMPNNTR
jgi:hypothetical protein